jgi:IS30 family transposase
MAKNKKKHLSDEERFCIEKMLSVSDTLEKIGRSLGRGKSTICEEVNSNGGRDKYKAISAINRAYLKQYRKKRNCNGVAMDGHSIKYIERRLEQGLSPGSISSRLKIQSGLTYHSEKSIRKFIKSRSGLERFLFWNRNKMKTGRKRSNDTYLNDPSRKWIEDRPVMANFEYGHWEMDFVVSKHNSTVLLVCVEKYSKEFKLAILPNRINETVNHTVFRLLKNEIVKTITTDNDIGFSKYKELEKLLSTEIYFCHPFHSWEKGLVENSNRWIREFVPKKSDIKLITEEFLNQIENYFNHKPREILGGHTAFEVKMEECGIFVESLEVNFPKVRIEG